MQKLDNRPERPTRFDFGLLLPLWALLEERSVSRAGVRLGLSQPAMSRKFQRLRIVFRDKLLVRSGMGYEPTARGRALQRELEALMPQLMRLFEGENFDPGTARKRFRLACTDEAAQLIGSELIHRIRAAAPEGN